MALMDQTEILSKILLWRCRMTAYNVTLYFLDIVPIQFRHIPISSLIDREFKSSF